MAEAGSIEIALRARVDRLEADLRKAEAATKKTSRGMKANFRSVAASLKKVKGNAVAATAVIVGLGTGAMAGLAKQAIRTANDIGDVSEKLGISSSALQEFQFAANQSGVRMEALNMGLQRFGRRAAEAAQGTGEAKDAIRQLGIQLNDSNGNLRSTEALFTDAMTSLAAIENPLERVRLGFKLFDSEGVALVNMAGNFGDLREEAQRLGLVIDDEVIQRADGLQDSFDALAAVTRGQLSGALTDIGGGALLSVAQTMADLATWAGSVYRNFADIANLGLSDTQLRLKTAQEELTKATKEYDEQWIKNGHTLLHIKRLEEDIVQLEAQAIRQKKARADAAAELVATEKAEKDKLKTQAELDAAEKKQFKAIEKRRALSKRAHEDYLEASGQRILAIQEELQADMAALSENLSAGEDYTDARIELEQTAALRIKKIRDEEAEDLADQLEDQNEMYSDLFDFMERGFSDSLATMLMDGEITFKTLAQSFVREFIQMGIGQLTAKGLGALSSMFGVDGIGTTTTTLPATTGTAAPWTLTANGGFRTSGQPLLVGERGPEMFFPTSSGFVASNLSLSNAGRGGGAPVTVTVINNSGSEASTTERDGPNGGRQIEVMIGQAISKNIARGGDVDQAIRNSYGVQRIGRHGL